MESRKIDIGHTTVYTGMGDLFWWNTPLFIRVWVIFLGGTPTKKVWGFTQK